MAILIISRNSVDHVDSTGKYPGIKLVEVLEEAGAFSLIDVPSCFYIKSMRGRLKLLARFLRAVMVLFRRRKDEVFFYNFSPAYLFLYIFSFCCRFSRPGIFLADGINCVGMRYNPSLFLCLFSRIISLPLNRSLTSRYSASPEFIWFPGSQQLTDTCSHVPRPAGQKVRLLFNSSLLPHNSPESVLTFVSNDEIEILITETEDNFRSYLNDNDVRADFSFPPNLVFLGPLTFDDYLDLITRRIDGILLCRDERVFANEYNFPSKLIEALQLDIPFFSMFPITSVSDSLYCLIDSSPASECSVRNHIERIRDDETYSFDKTTFMSLCDVSRVSRWLRTGCEYESRII